MTARASLEAHSWRWRRSRGAGAGRAAQQSQTESGPVPRRRSRSDGKHCRPARRHAISTGSTGSTAAPRVVSTASTSARPFRPAHASALPARACVSPMARPPTLAHAPAPRPPCGSAGPRRPCGPHLQAEDTLVRVGWAHGGADGVVDVPRGPLDRVQPAHGHVQALPPRHPPRKLRRRRRAASSGVVRSTAVAGAGARRGACSCRGTGRARAG